MVTPRTIIIQLTWPYTTPLVHSIYLPFSSDGFKIRRSMSCESKINNWDRIIINQTKNVDLEKKCRKATNNLTT